MINLHKLYKLCESAYQNVNTENIGQTIKSLVSSFKLFQTVTSKYGTGKDTDSPQYKKKCDAVCSMTTSILDAPDLSTGDLWTRKHLREHSFKQVQAYHLAKHYHCTKNGLHFLESDQGQELVSKCMPFDIYVDNYIDDLPAGIHNLNLALNYNNGHKDSDLFYRNFGPKFIRLDVRQLKSFLNEDMKYFQKAIKEYPEVAYYGENVPEYTQTSLL